MLTSILVGVSYALVSIGGVLIGIGLKERHRSLAEAEASKRS